MAITRRSLLKGAVAAGAATAVVGDAQAREKVQVEPKAVGMLYDSTLCIGCRACVTKCKEANGLPYDRSKMDGGVYDAPIDLNGDTKNIIKVARKEGKKGEETKFAFMKQQCMHCVDPSCVSVCMFGGFHKEGHPKIFGKGETKGTGIVLWDKYLCVGCRYCQIACAFNVPKFEWYKALPYIVKCELCEHRGDPKKQGALAVANPACCEVCPRDAVIYGYRSELIEVARRRLVADPKRYNGQIYGLKEGGGTQVLYLAPAGFTFKELGLPELPEESSAAFSESVSHAPYLHGLTPIALYVGMAALIRRNKKREEEAEAGHHGEGER